MSPTSCRCSTPRRIGSARIGSASLRATTAAGGARGGLASRGVAPAVLFRRCAGSRPGSGWDRVGPARSRPRTPPPSPSRRACRGAPRRDPAASAPTGPDDGVASMHGAMTCLAAARTAPHRTAAPRADATGFRVADGCSRTPGRASRAGRGFQPESGRPFGLAHPPSAIRTARLRSVARRPPAAYQPGRLPGALPLSGDGEARLGEGFPLRCFQRFARPDVATQRCRLPDNWPTSGPSTPVLSY